MKGNEKLLLEGLIMESKMIPGKLILATNCLPLKEDCFAGVVVSEGWDRGYCSNAWEKDKFKLWTGHIILENYL